MLQQYDVSTLQYKECHSELKSSLKHCAGSIEMMALSMFMKDRSCSMSEVKKHFHEATTKYSNVKQENEISRFLMRINLIYFEMLKIREDFVGARDLYVKAGETVKFTSYIFILLFIFYSYPCFIFLIILFLLIIFLSFYLFLFFILFIIYFFILFIIYLFIHLLFSFFVLGLGEFYSWCSKRTNSFFVFKCK